MKTTAFVIPPLVCSIITILMVAWLPSSKCVAQEYRTYTQQDSRDRDDGGEGNFDSKLLQEETRFSRDQLSGSLFKLAEELARLRSESNREPTFDYPEAKEPTVVEAMQKDILESREKLNAEFESTQATIEKILSEQAARREKMRQQLTPLLENAINQNAANQNVDGTADNGANPAEGNEETSDADLPIDSAIAKIREKASAVNANGGIRFVNAKSNNKLALADNVFATGDVSTAGKLYAELITESHSKRDLRWIKFQLAACYRSTKQLNEAERLLREITNEDDEEFPAEQARWWLGMIEKRLVHEAKVQAFDNAIQAYGKAGHDAENE